MSVLKNLWGSVQGDPTFMRRLNGWLTIFWVAMIPISFQLGWLKSVTYVSALSLWALVSGHWSTWQAARVEVSQRGQIEKEAESPVEERVVEKLVEETSIESTGEGPVWRQGFWSSTRGLVMVGDGWWAVRGDPGTRAGIGGRSRDLFGGFAVLIAIPIAAVLATLVDATVRSEDPMIPGVESLTDEEDSRGAVEFAEGLSRLTPPPRALAA